MQQTDVVFDCLGKKRWYSCLDAARGYHQFEIAKEDRWKTAFVTEQGMYQYTTMLFGLHNAPAIFQWFMDNLVGSLRWKSALVYIDDVIMFSDKVEEHCLALSQILHRVSEIGLKFSMKKCFFGFDSLRILGRMVSPEGLGVLLDKMAVVATMPNPTTLGEFWTILGMFGYY